MAAGVGRQLKHLNGLRRHLGMIGALRYRLAAFQRKPLHRATIKGVPLWIRPRSPDLWVAADSLGAEFDGLAAYLDADFDGVIIDAGAYIGSAALKLAGMFPRAQVVCIEASAENAELLNRNVADHQRIDVIHAALAATSGETVKLRDRGTGQWGFTIVPNPEDSPDGALMHEIATITVGEIAARYPGRPIGLMKLDIEGGEKVLFAQGSADLAAIPILFVELHDRITAGCTAAFMAFSEGREVVSFGGEKFLSHRTDQRRNALNTADAPQPAAMAIAKDIIP